MTSVAIGNGKRKTLYAKTKPELKKKEEDLKLKLRDGFDIVTSEDTFAQWVERLKLIQEPRMTPSEFSTLCFHLEFFLPFLGSRALSQIKPLHIQPLIDRLALENPRTHCPTAKKTIKYYLLSVSRVFELAIDNRACSFNPCRAVALPIDASVKKRRALTREEQRMIMNAPDCPMKLAALLAMTCGLRRGEIAALMWSDIDMIEKTVSITKSYDFKEFKIKPPKTKAGVRVVPIPTPTVIYLMNQPRNSVLVVNEQGKRLTGRQWEARWEKFLGEMAAQSGAVFGTQKVIERFTLHELRHTYATNLKDAGVIPKDAQYLLGHADIATTMNTYTHTDEDSHKNAVQKLEHLMDAIG